MSEHAAGRFTLDPSKQTTLSVPRAYWDEEPVAVLPVEGKGGASAPEGMEYFARIVNGRSEAYLVPVLRRVVLPSGEVFNALEIMQEYGGGRVVAIDRRASTVTVQAP